MDKRWIATGFAALLASAPAVAYEFGFYDIEGVVKSQVSENVAMRLDTPDQRLIAKNSVNKSLCGFTDADSCYAFNGNQANNARLVAAPGAFFASNRDDGDINYAQGSLVSAVTRISSDLTMTWGDFAFKAGALAYLDPRNYYFTNTHWDDPIDPRIGQSYQPHHDARQQNIRDNAGKEWVLKNLLVAGTFKVFDEDIGVNVGYQHIRWGESTLLALNSISEINAPDARLLYQPGTQIAEIFRPTPALSISGAVAEGLRAEVVYLFGWDAVHVPSGGEFFAPYDILKEDRALLSLGQFHEDPNCRQRLPGVGGDFSDTCLTVPFDSNTHAPGQGQFGGKLSWFSAEINGGTEFGFYALNYHSRLPYLSFRAGNATCIQESTVDVLQALVDCQGFRLVPTGREAFPISSIRGFADYPKNIQMFGVSFNTNLEKWSLAGEMSFRPNLPVQIAAPDLLMTAAQPSLPAHDICFGGPTVVPLGGLTGAPSTCAFPTAAGAAAFLASPLALQLAASPRFQDVLGQAATHPTDVYVVPARRTALPDYTSVYRGQTIQPNQYVAGYERLQAVQLDLTGIRAFGNTDNPIGADQIILITELGLSWFPNMPSKRRLQFEAGDLNGTHYSAGADGSGDPAGTPAGRQPSGAYAASRFNPHQQRSGYATPLSTGYRLIVRVEYDNIFGLGWNYKPQLIWAHDVYGRAPLPMQNFIQGSKSWQWINEIEFSNQWSAQLLYQGSTGGGTVNYLRDKDILGAVVNYSF